MRGILNILIFCIITAQSVLFAQPAHAGAWLRELDTAFLSVGATIRHHGDLWRTENSLYAEYGLRQRLTLGMDINETAGLSGHVLVFARVPVGPVQRHTKMALELGVGGHHRQGQWQSMLKSSISVGRGFESRWGAGWFNVDAAVELRRPNRKPTYKLDATLGLPSVRLSARRRIRPLLQFETTYASGKPLIWSIIPGVLIDGRNASTWLIGLERKTAGQSNLGLKFGLKFGLWRQF